VIFAALLINVSSSGAGDLSEVVNKSKIKILNISPAVEYFKSECKRDHENVDCLYEIYKSGYKVKLLNGSNKESAVKIDLLLDYLGEGKVFDYMVYDIIGPREAKTIFVMCDNIPVDCLKKRGKDAMSTNCNKQVLSLWDKHVKRLVVDTLD
jgi:hypothetical protein